MIQIPPGSCCVYAITSPSGDVYVGKTKQQPATRWGQHQRPNGKNKGASAIFGAIRKYGAKNMHFGVLVVLPSEEEAYRVEVALIAAWGTLSPTGYNLNSGGKGGFIASSETRRKQKAMWTPERKQRAALAYSGPGNPQYGKKASEALRAKLSASHKGRIFSTETRQKLSEALKGRIVSAAQREAMSRAKKGKVPHAALQAAIVTNTGRPLSAEHRKKVGDAQRGEKNWAYGIKLTPERRAQCDSFTGRKHTSTTKLKMAKARRAFWARKKNNDNN